MENLGSLSRSPSAENLDLASSVEMPRGQHALGTEQTTIAKVQGTLTGFFTTIANFFTSAGRARNALAKPTAELTSAIKFIQDVNARLDGTPFEKVTFENLPDYIEALKQGKVLYKQTEEIEDEVVSTIVSVNPTAALEGRQAEDKITWGDAQGLFNLSTLGKDLRTIARDNAAAVTGATKIEGMYKAERKPMIEIFETAQKTIDVWQKTILKAGEGLSDAEFRGLVEVSTNAVTNADSGVDAAYLQKNTAKLWADNMVERFTKEFADTVAPIMTGFDAKVEAEVKVIQQRVAGKVAERKQGLIEIYQASKATLEIPAEFVEVPEKELARINAQAQQEAGMPQTAIRQEAMITVMDRQAEELNEAFTNTITPRATELREFGGMSNKQAFETILTQLQNTPAFKANREEMVRAVQTVGNDHRTFSTVAGELLGEISTFHTAIQTAGKGLPGEVSGEDAVRVDVANANRGRKTLVATFMQNTPDAAKTADDVLGRAAQQHQAIMSARGGTQVLLKGHQDAVDAAEEVASQAEKTLAVLNFFNAPNQDEVELKDQIDEQVVTEEISEQLLDRIASLHGNEETQTAPSPTLLRDLLLSIQSEEGGLMNVLGIDNKTDVGNFFVTGAQLNAGNVGIEEEGVQLYTFAEGAKEYLAQIVRERKAEIAEAKAEELARLQQEEMERQLKLASSIALPDLSEEDEAFLLGEGVVVSSQQQSNAVVRFFQGIGEWFSSIGSRKAPSLEEREVTFVQLPSSHDEEEVGAGLRRVRSEDNLGGLLFGEENSERLDRPMRRVASSSDLRVVTDESLLRKPAATNPTVVEDFI